jgi:hypothetical protein
MAAPVPQAVAGTESAPTGVEEAEEPRPTPQQGIILSLFQGQADPGSRRCIQGERASSIRYPEIHVDIVGPRDTSKNLQLFSPPRYPEPVSTVEKDMLVIVSMVPPEYVDIAGPRDTSKNLKLFSAPRNSKSNTIARYPPEIGNSHTTAPSTSD